MGATSGQTEDGLTRRGLARPMTRESSNRLLKIAGLLMVVAGGAGFILGFTAPELVAHPFGLAAVCSAAIVVGVVVGVGAIRDVDLFHRFLPQFVYGLFILAPILITLGQYVAGPRTLVAVVLYVETPIFAFYLLPRPLAAAIVALVAAEFGVLLLVQPGYPAPLTQWLFLAASLGTIGAIVGGLLSNAVEESMRLSRLRRFLSPQVADAVLSSGSETMLEPHRRQIAVLFCDLRGYTKFSGSSEPEEVVEMLDQYYEVVGELLRESAATIGSFGGDGIMAYFNDPVPCVDPAGTAVNVGLGLREPMARFVAAWGRRGFQLSYGVGVAYGYATLGIVGFEGRHDYTPLGSVVNLAARLSDEAGPGEILVDQRTHDAICERCDADPVTLELKGFTDPVTAYRVGDTSTIPLDNSEIEPRAAGKERAVKAVERRA